MPCKCSALSESNNKKSWFDIFVYFAQVRVLMYKKCWACAGGELCSSEAWEAARNQNVNEAAAPFCAQPTFLAQVINISSAVDWQNVDTSQNNQNSHHKKYIKLLWGSNDTFNPCFTLPAINGPKHSRGVSCNDESKYWSILNRSEPSQVNTNKSAGMLTLAKRW